MMIVEIDSDQTWETPRRVYYKVTDDFGGVTYYGPVFTSDPAFDPEAFKTTVAAKVAENLAEQEFNEVIG
jgi:hypothetical protein